VLAERGFAGATIREIATRAGVNPALLHYYFGTKAGLHSAVIAQVYETLRAHSEALRPGTGSVISRLRELVRAYVTIISREPYLARMIVEEIMAVGEDGAEHFMQEIGERLSKGLADLIEEGVQNGELRDLSLPFDIRTTSANLLFLFLVAPFAQQPGSARVISQDLAEGWAQLATDLILNGIATS
jgi:AcrR family transcriptional regulator